MPRKNEKFFIEANEKKFRVWGYKFKFINKDEYDPEGPWAEPIELGIKTDDIVLPRDEEVDYTIGRNRMLVVMDSIWNMSKYWWLDKLYMLCLIILQVILYIVGFKLFVR